MSVRIGKTADAPAFPVAAKQALRDEQLRSNVHRATSVIRGKRGLRVEELPDWENLRQAASDIKAHTLAHLDHYLAEFERNCELAGGHVHWARDADEANAIAIDLIRHHGGNEVIKVKTMTSDEIGLNPALEAAGITPYETDLADMIVQMGDDEPSHIVVPALHRNRTEVRDLFRAKMNRPELSDLPEELTAAARGYLRERFLSVKIGVCGVNFAIAETGGVCVVESEGNGRMCVTLPDVLIALVGIEKVIPAFGDLEVFLQLLPRSATGERMNPYNSVWTGVRPGDGPREFHVILLDNGRTKMLRDDLERETLACIRCGACLNACPVYRETGGHAYGSIYSGPIGAILSPQLQSLEHSRSLPYASTLCGACYEVCPVKINIPEILIHLRGRIVREDQKTFLGNLSAENLAMKAAAAAFMSPRRYEAAQRLARAGQTLFKRDGELKGLPGMAGGWTRFRDLKPIPAQSFRDWWRKRESNSPAQLEPAPPQQPHAVEAQSRKLPDRSAAASLTGPTDSAREAVLASIRAALPGPVVDPSRSHDAVRRSYGRGASLGRVACLELFVDRLRDYDAEVLEVEDETGLPGAIRNALQVSHEEHVAVAAAFPLAWLPNGISVAVDDGLSIDSLERAQAVVTTSETAIASSGTIILVHEGAQGRRALTLLPDHHICLVRRDRVHEILPEALTAIAGQTALPITTISGPSATSDIEMTRVRGVHGPRRLTVVLYGPI